MTSLLLASPSADHDPQMCSMSRLSLHLSGYMQGERKAKKKTTTTTKKQNAGNIKKVKYLTFNVWSLGKHLVFPIDLTLSETKSFKTTGLERLPRQQSKQSKLNKQIACVASVSVRERARMAQSVSVRPSCKRS